MRIHAVGPLALGLIAALAIMPDAAVAQVRTFPWKQVTIVVPQAVGGSSDALSRMLSDRLAAALKQPVIVDNRPGAGGNIGMELVAEAGFPQLQLNAWFGLFAPTGTPPAVVERLRAEINATLKSKEVAERIRDQGAEVFISSAEEFDALLKSDFQRFGKLAGELGLKLD